MKPHRHRITDQEELDLASEVLRRLGMLKHVNDWWDRLRNEELMPSSQLAEDDRATSWLNASHQVRAYLNLCADMVAALERLLIVDNTLQVPMHAHYPLLRSIIESGAQALWILDPEDHETRVQRALQARVVEQKWDSDFHQEVVRSGTLYGQVNEGLIADGQAKIDQRETEIMAKIRQLGDAAGIPWGTIVNGPSTVGVIRRIGKVGDIPGEFAASVWRLISGLTHPSASRATNYSHVEILREDGDGNLSARMSVSMNWTHQALLVALNMYARAVGRFRIRRTKPHTE